MSIDIVCFTHSVYDYCEKIGDRDKILQPPDRILPPIKDPDEDEQ